MNRHHIIATLLTLPTILTSAHDIAQRRDKARTEMREVARVEYAEKESNRSWGQQLLDTFRSSQRLERDALVDSWDFKARAQYEADKEAGRFAHEYVTPVWHPAMRKFFGAFSCAVDCSATYAGKAFDRDGVVVERPQLDLGVPKLVEVLPASALAVESPGSVANGAEFLSDLAESSLVVKGNERTRQVQIGVHYGLLGNKVQLGAYIPVIEKIRTLSLYPDITENMAQNLRDRTIDDDGFVRNSTFRELFGIDMTMFWKDLIERRGMTYRSENRRIEIPSFNLFISTNLQVQGVAQWTVTAEALIPGMQRTDFSTFYPVEHANEAAPSMRISTGFVTNDLGGAGALDAMVSWRFFFPSTEQRFVSRQLVLKDILELPTTELYYQEITFDAARDVRMPVSQNAYFSPDVVDVGMRLGSEVSMRCGYTMPALFSRFVKTTLFAQGFAKSSDELMSHLSSEDYYGQSLENSDSKYAVTVGAQWVYQPSAHVHVRAGIHATVAGRLMPCTMGGNIGFSCDW